MKTGPWGAILTALFRTSVWQGREGPLSGGMRTFSPVPERLFARTRRRGLEILFATTPDVSREHATATGAARMAISQRSGTVAVVIPGALLAPGFSFIRRG